MSAQLPAAADAPLDARARLTFRLDCIRGACSGLLESGMLAFGLVIVIRHFEGPAGIKALVSSANAIGLLLTPLGLFIAARLGWTASSAASRNFAGGAVCLVAAALSPNLWLYVPAILLAAILLSQQGPLMVHIYTTNYPAHRRGRLLSNAIVLSLITAVTFSLGGGRLLDWDLGLFRILLACMASAALIASVTVGRMPAEPFPREPSNNPLRAWRYAWEDRTFGAMLFVWFLMGFGNLMMLPLRVEYMANPAFGINATNAQIALITAVIPSGVRLATTHLWGALFDRYNFFIIRTVLNAFFLVGIVMFFSTREIWMLWIAAGMFGVAMAGGNIAWNLWVTKFAPPERTADYMSVHTFLTGVRGILGPFLGFWAIARFTPFATALFAAGLIALSMILIDPLRRKHKRAAAS